MKDYQKLRLIARQRRINSTIEMIDNLQEQYIKAVESNTRAFEHLCQTIQTTLEALNEDLYRTIDGYFDLVKKYETEEAEANAASQDKQSNHGSDRNAQSNQAPDTSAGDPRIPVKRGEAKARRSVRSRPEHDELLLEGSESDAQEDQT